MVGPPVRVGGAKDRGSLLRLLFFRSLIALCVNSYYEPTTKGKIDEPQTHPQLPFIVIGAAKENETKILEIVTFSENSLNNIVKPRAVWSNR